MEDEINLGKYFRPIQRHYGLGLLLFAIVAVIVVVAQFLRPVTYTATATLFAESAQYSWRFDSRIAPNPMNRNWQQLFTILGQEPWVQEAIRQTIANESGKEPEGEVTITAGKQALIYVSAKASTPEKAAELANRWSQAFIEMADRLYGTSALVDPFAATLALVEKRYRDADQAVMDFKATTGVGLPAEGQTMLEGYEWMGPLGLELAEKGRQLAQHRVAVSNLNLLIAQFNEAKKNGSALTVLPWQLLAVPAIQERGVLSPTVILAQLDNPQQVEALLATELAVQQQTAKALEEEVKKTQKEVADLVEQLYRLVEERILTKEAYQIIRRKVEEISIQTGMEGLGLLQLMSPAQVPERPTPPPWGEMALLIIAVGGIVGLAGCYLADFVESRMRRE